MIRFESDFSLAIFSKLFNIKNACVLDWELTSKKSGCEFDF